MLNDYEKKLMAAMKALEAQGNSADEATEILARLIHDSTMSLPQRAHYPRSFCELRQLEQNTARVQLRKLPHGDEILKQESYC